MDLSTTEAGLLYSIKSEPGKTITYYGDQLKMTSGFLTRPLEKLVRLGYVERTHNKLTISEAFLQKEAEQKASAPVAVVVETKPVVEVPAVETAVKVSPEMIAKYMADKEPRTAAVIAQHFGHAKGTVLINPLRKLVTDGVLGKVGTVYSWVEQEIQNPEPEVVTVETVVEAVAEIAVDLQAEDSDEELAARIIAALENPKTTEPETPVKDGETFLEFVEKQFDSVIPLSTGPTDVELTDAILGLRHQAFTADEALVRVRIKNESVIRADFLRVFEDVADSGELLAWDGVEFVDPHLDYAPDLKFIVRRSVDPSECMRIMDDYCKSNKAPYRLFAIVEDTRLDSVDVLRYLEDMTYNADDFDNIFIKPFFAYGKGKPTSAPAHTNTHGDYPKAYQHKRPSSAPLIRYEMIETLKPTAITAFLDGGVKVDVFIRKFNLHPDDREHILDVLTKTQVAEVTSVEGVQWLFLKSRKAVTVNDTELAKIGTLTAPTGEPARKWTPVEKADLKSALQQVAQEENRLITACDLDPSLPETTPSGELSALMSDALDLISDSAADKLDNIGKLRAAINSVDVEPSLVFMSRELADELQIPITECICEHRTFGDELHEDACPVAVLENESLTDPMNCHEGLKGPSGTSEKVAYRENRLLSPGISVNEGIESFAGFPPDPQWSLTLKMLEERLRFEHQGSAADQLHEIRKYLEP